MQSSNEITVRVLKHDGTEYRRWQAQLSRKENSLLVLDAEFEVDVTHEVLGVIPRGTRTVEYYWLDRWYNVFRFLSEDDNTRFYYCNINTPPELNDSVLTYIDLDIDIIVQPAFSFQVLDLEEFEFNAEEYGYSNAERQAADAAVQELISMIERREFPFLIEHFSASSMVNL